MSLKNGSEPRPTRVPATIEVRKEQGRIRISRPAGETRREVLEKKPNRTQGETQELILLRLDRLEELVTRDQESRTR